jgi:hypothetical protein
MNSNPGTPHSRVVAFDTSAIVPQQVWSKSLATGSGNRAWDVTADPQGNVIVAGTFQGTLDFDPGPGKTNLSSGNGGGTQTAYIWKLDADGDFVWARHFAVGNGGTSSARQIFSDPAGNVTFAGTFKGSVDFDPGKPKLSLPNAGGFDLYLAKLSAAGNLVFAKSYGSAADDRYRDMVSDAAGNFYLLTWPGATQAVVMKLTSTGQLQWSMTLSSSIDVLGYALAVDPATSRIHVLGTFVGDLDTDGDTVPDLTTDDDALDIFWLIYDQT